MEIDHELAEPVLAHTRYKVSARARAERSSVRNPVGVFNVWSPPLDTCLAVLPTINTFSSPSDFL